uniref:ATP synthase F0 subunit 6 n=1 Tax=Diostrombus politus TaxID=130564 RepID=UPI002A8362E9|nr:ATP synthase F0 subunit 6 [Diostrombus politus]WOW99039.1 ATP synthase F0 subunit 6 [Diostrombus politus]
MMNSLFSTFDPMTTKLQMNWITIFSPLILYPMNFWISKSRIQMMKKMIEMKLMSEFKTITKHKEILLLTNSMFLTILMINFMGLMPYVFTPTSHMSLSMSMALPMWLMLMIYGWIKFSNHMLSHLLPTGTPQPIMPMMVMIELTGNLIRPISLSVRLTANMIAGHLLMTLLGNMNETKMIMMIMPMQIIIMTFESAIAIIQAYVFSTLATLYSMEIP